MPAKHTRETHLALLLPMALSQGWSTEKLARTAQIDNGLACKLLKSAAEEARVALGRVESVDVLSLTVEIDGKPVTLGKIKGKMVTGAVRSLARLPEELDQWTESNDKTYRRCHTVLRDAKALGLIRFGEAEQSKIPQPIRPVDPFEAQSKAGKRAEGEKSPTESSTMNDGEERSTPDAAPKSPQTGEGEE